MTQFIFKAVFSFVPLALLCCVANGQDIPAVITTSPNSGFQLPIELGTFHYALTFGERVRTGYYGTGGEVWSTNISGDAGYLSKSEKHPFSMSYSGGYLYNSGAVPSSVFQDFNLSQTYNTRLWNTNISDAVSYLPETPSSGLSGIPGVGDVGVTAPPVGSETGQDILTLTGQRITNSTSVSVQRQLTGSTGLQGVGSYYIQRFLSGGNGNLDTQSISAQATVNHRIDALNQAQSGYSYDHFSYLGQDFTFSTQSITAGYTRQINRKVNANASVGPQFTSSSGSSSSNSTVNVSVKGGVAYSGQREQFTATFARGVRGGSGVAQGTFADTVSVGATRAIGEYMHIAAEGGYSHNSSIANPTNQQLGFQTITANLEVSRTISQNINAFISYDVEKQSTSTLATSTRAFSGTSQSVGFGITYSPHQLHVGH